MLPTTAQFDAAAIATVRKPRARVTITWTDPYIDASIIADPGTQRNETCWPNQVADIIETVPHKWAHCDDQTPLLDGIYPMPGTSLEALDYQVGWWGKDRGNGFGYFPSAQHIELTFSARPIITLKVVGDSAYNEYPRNFVIRIYNGAGGATLIKTVTVVANTLLSWSADLSADGITNCTRMTLDVTKWSAGNRVLKITEFYTAIEIIYDGDEIIKMGILEEMELTDGSVPIGNISANEMDLSLNNVDDKFFPGNTAATLHTLMKKNRKIRPEIGFKLPGGAIEYIPMGVYWSGDWKTSELGTDASTTARDRMELLRKSTFYTGEIYENYTLYDLAVVVFESARVIYPDLVYNIDTELQDFTIPYAYFKKVSHFEAIRLITNACLGRAYADRMGVVQVMGPTDPSGAYELEITADNYFQRDQPANSENVINVVEVTTKPLTPDAAPTADFYVSDEMTLAIGTHYKTIQFKEPPVKDVTVTPELITATATMTATCYAWGADVTITVTVAGTLKIKASGTLFQIIGSQVVSDEDSASILDYGRQRYEFPENHLIQTTEIAEAIIVKLLESFKDPYKDILLDWRGNPALELADVIKAPEYVKNGIDIRARFWSTKQTLDFDGTLRATLSGRKIPNSEIDILQDTFGTGEGTIQDTFATTQIIQNVY